MLTCDAFGVLPPIAKLDPAQAMYHFLSGYTAKVAGTEKGVTEPQATFSTCFGAPFMPLHPTVYGDLLRELYRAPSRRLLARQHRLDGRQVRRRAAHADPRDAPPARRRARRLAAEGRFPHRSAFRPRRADARCRASSRISSIPCRTWRHKGEFAETAGRLVKMFRDNFRKFENAARTRLSAPPAPRRASSWREVGRDSASRLGVAAPPSPSHRARPAGSGFAAAGRRTVGPAAKTRQRQPDQAVSAEANEEKQGRER